MAVWIQGDTLESGAILSDFRSVANHCNHVAPHDQRECIANLITDDGNILTIRVRSYRTATLTSFAAMSAFLFP